MKIFFLVFHAHPILFEDFEFFIYTFFIEPKFIKYETSIIQLAAAFLSQEIIKLVRNNLIAFSQANAGLLIINLVGFGINNNP